MDFVDGTDAGELAGNHPGTLSVDDVLEIVDAVAEALDFAHERRLLHRDVKPANILLTTPTTGRRRTLLADFGIARQADEISGLTSTNMAVGTVSYAAPEQLMGEPLDGRADQYALAATAYHLLAGRPPFMHSNPAVVISKHLTAPPPALSEARPEMAHLDAALAHGLAKDRADRYPTCVDFATALRQAERAFTSAPATSTNMTARPASPGRQMSADATMGADAFAAAPTQLRPTGFGSEVDEVSIALNRRWWLRKSVLITAAMLTVIALIMAAVTAIATDRQRLGSQSAEPLSGWTMPIQGSQVSVEPPNPALETSPAVLAARPSVVKIRNVPSQCRQVDGGSGFVVAPNRVISAARIVSGSGSVTVEAEGRAYDATVVSYDPTIDVAVLDVPGLQERPLAFVNQPAPTDADAVVLGYTDAGDFKATPARIREIIELNGPDIYRTTTASREMYAVRGVVRRTDLGGPLVNASGRVLGIVIGASADDADTAYALSAKQLVAPLSTIGNTQPVSTGDCA
jgi:hypothetical protein